MADSGALPTMAASIAVNIGNLLVTFSVAGVSGVTKVFTSSSDAA